MSRERLFACLSMSIVAILVAAWITSFFGEFGLGTRYGKFDHHLAFQSGNFCVGRNGNYMAQGLYWHSNRPLAPDGDDLPQPHARLQFWRFGPGYWNLKVPIFLLITAMIPFVVGSFSGFRFHLWQYFVFTALAALALAYSRR